MWSTLSLFEQNVLNSEAYFRMSQMAKDFFYNDKTAAFLLQSSLSHYFQSLDSLYAIMKNLSLNKFTAQKYITSALDLKTSDINSIFNFLVDREKDVISAGVRIMTE